MFELHHITVIGLGGVGHRLFSTLFSLVETHTPVRTIHLVDHDVFEERNRDRQWMAEPGKQKALAVAEKLAPRYPQLTFIPIAEKLTPSNAAKIVRENSLICLCVDNHDARRATAEAATQRNNILLVSGSNEKNWVKACAHLRDNGEDRSLPLNHKWYREITEEAPPSDSSRNDDSTQDQMILENDTAANLMAQIINHWLLTEDVICAEIDVGLDSGKEVRTSPRKQFSFTSYTSNHK